MTWSCLEIAEPSATSRTGATFSTEDVLEYYHRLGFDYGVSVDHIVLPEFAHQRSYRYKLTLRNAEDFLRMHRDGELGFTPVGAAQVGTSAHTSRPPKPWLEWATSTSRWVASPRSSTKEISRIVTAVSDVVADRARLHVFGVARASLLPLLLELGVTSADSAAPLRPGVAGREGQLLHERRRRVRRHPDPSGDGGAAALSGFLVARSEARYTD